VLEVWVRGEFHLAEEWRQNDGEESEHCEEDVAWSQGERSYEESDREERGTAKGKGRRRRQEKARDDGSQGQGRQDAHRPSRHCAGQHGQDGLELTRPVDAFPGRIDPLDRADRGLRPARPNGPLPPYQERAGGGILHGAQPHTTGQEGTMTKLDLEAMMEGMRAQLERDQAAGELAGITVDALRQAISHPKAAETIAEAMAIEAGSVREGDPAPDFSLPWLESGSTARTGPMTLSSHLGRRPVALVFGSYT
jgi:hypothetical protein